MFTSLTIAAAWFSFGYNVTDFMMRIAAANRKGLYDDRTNKD
jgi:hypothetical protein